MNYTLHVIANDERPVKIVDPGGILLFSFKAEDAEIAQEMLQNLNNPPSELEDAA